MTLQMNQILSFSQFHNTIQSAKLPIKTTYKLSRLAAAIEVESDFYREKFREILDTYCQKDEEGRIVSTEDGAGYKVIEEKLAECNNAINELQTIEVELPNITFDISEFDGVELSIRELEGIMPFITE